MPHKQGRLSVRVFVLLFAMMLLPFAAGAQMPCSYDCLARGGLPEICDMQCGGSVVRPTSQRTQANENQDDAPKKSTRQVEPYRSAYDFDDEGDAAGDGSSASGGKNVYFSCIKECRDAGNKLQDCRALCSED